MRTERTKIDKNVSLLHGAGGEMMNDLIADVLTKIKNKNAGGIGLESLDDGAAIPLAQGGFLIFTTDTHVVKPIFFPGGDIGRLSVSGTVNDLAMMGAAPLALTSAIVMEDGFAISDLRKIVASMDEATQEVDTAIVTGDTKVVEKGALDGIIINTAGIGFVEKPIPAVLMMIPSSAPFSTTFVSPVTIAVSTSWVASSIDATILRKSLMANPSSITIALVRASGAAPIIARSFTVPDTESRPISPPGKKMGLTTCVSVVKMRKPPCASGMAAPSSNDSKPMPPAFLFLIFVKTSAIKSFIISPPAP